VKLLLDECVPVDFRHHVIGHDVFTCVSMRWTGIGNGRLLALAAGDGFEAVITTDGNMEHQINPATMPVAVVILDVPSNDLADLVPLVDVAAAAKQRQSASPSTRRSSGAARRNPRYM
jgi:hypothetical protein